MFWKSISNLKIALPSKPTFTSRHVVNKVQTTVAFSL